MVEALGNEPVESEIPVDFEDLMLNVQVAILTYNRLKDEYDGMSGRYTGKNFAGIIDILTLMEIEQEDRQEMFNIISILDDVRKAVINTRSAAEAEAQKALNNK